MPTLLMRLDAPIQSWGVVEEGQNRPSSPHPSKSGVIGMIAAALGLDREADLSHLYALDFGVRVDRPGTLLTDFHTARRMKTVEPDSLTEAIIGYPSNPEYESVTITRREYIADGAFTVALLGGLDLLNTLAAALVSPVYLLYLGRRGCPAPPFSVSVAEEGELPTLELLPDVDDPLSALRGADLIDDGAVLREYETPATLPVYVDSPAGKISAGDRRYRVSDVHLSRNGWRRTFTDRVVLSTVVPTPDYSVGESDYDDDDDFHIIGM